ncbi:ankyrin repeat-containing domain protein [Xylariaceae sp. FL0804]|nr:ankyrin repeat-containing domain protein [Xylariaceae sp. FL0804]
MAAEMLKIILFRCSNKVNTEDSRHSTIILGLIDEVSRTNPELLTRLLVVDCPTTQAIKEAVYSIATQGCRYDLVSQLLKAGMDPKYQINNPEHKYFFEKFPDITVINRGRCSIHFDIDHPLRVPGLTIAAIKCDTRLEELFLRTAPDIDPEEAIKLLELAALSEEHNSALEFTKMLIEYCDRDGICGTRKAKSRYSPALAISILIHNNPLAYLLIGKGAECNLTGLPTWDINKDWKQTTIRSGYTGMSSKGLRCTPLNIAIFSWNHEMAVYLLESALAQSGTVPLQTFKEALLIACLAGNLTVTEKILSSDLDLDLNQGWTTGGTPLVAAAWNKDLRIAELLLQMGASFQSDPWQTASIPTLHVAALHGNSTLVQLLLNRGADCRQRVQRDEHYPFFADPDLSTPFQLALRSGDAGTAAMIWPFTELIGGELSLAVKMTLQDKKLISAILDKVVDFNETVCYGEAVLFGAVAVQNPHIMALYFDSGGPYMSEALKMAAEAASVSKDYSIVELLAAHRPLGPVNYHENHALCLAVRTNDWRLANLLLQEPFQASWGGPDPLEKALSSKNVSFVEAILDWGYYPLECRPLECRDILGLLDDEDDTSQYDQAEAALRTLIRGRFPLDSLNLDWRRELLMRSIKIGNVRKVTQRIALVGSCNFFYHADSYNSNAFTQGAWGMFSENYGEDLTPLQLAAKNGHIAILEALLEAGGDVNTPASISGATALQWAVREGGGKLDVVRFLIEHGADVNAPAAPENGATALQWAVLGGNGNLDVVRFLIDQDADVNALPARSNGRTALEAAAQMGRLDTVQLLLDNNVDLHGAMRIYYVRAVLFAQEEGHDAVARLLQERGSWCEKDHQLGLRRYVRPRYHCGHFKYDREANDWHYWDSPEDRDWFCSGCDSRQDLYTWSSLDDRRVGGDKAFCFTCRLIYPYDYWLDDEESDISERSDQVDEADQVAAEHVSSTEQAIWDCIDLELGYEEATAGDEALGWTPGGSGLDAEIAGAGTGTQVGFRRRDEQHGAEAMNVIIGEDAFFGVGEVDDVWEVL